MGDTRQELRRFDPSRGLFAPYGFTCDIWEAREMPRANRHDEIELNFVDRGSLDYLFGGELVTVRQQCLTAFWAAVPHQTVGFRDVNFYYVVTIPFGWVLQWELPSSLVTALVEGRIVTETDPTCMALDQQLMKMWHEDLASECSASREVVALELKARLLRLALSVQPASSNSGPAGMPGGERPALLLDKAEAMACFVARSYTSRIQVKDIAESVGLHPDYAATLFRKTFGVTLNALLNRHRIAHAQRLLVTTDMQIVEIAYESGFDTLSCFNRAFKLLAAMTPREYRKTVGRPIAAQMSQSFTGRK